VIHPLLQTPLGPFEVHRLPCVECVKIISDNRAAVIKAEAANGIQINVSCKEDQ
jgi:hypothetical protein